MVQKENLYFKKLMESKSPVGEVVEVQKFMIRAKGLQPCTLHSLVMFEDGSKGFVNQIEEGLVSILHMGNKEIQVGSLVVLQHHQLLTKVGKDFIGRIISVNGQPLDGKGPIAASAARPIFNKAPDINQREALSDQLETGVIAIDSLFPIVKGQRMALIGDAKSGKSTLATQIAINQKNTDQILIYCLIAKRKIDIDTIVSRLSQNGGMDKVIIVVATMFDSLVLNYLAPYVACTIGEYLWHEENRNVVVVYDDLTAHAHTYREISLLSGVSPGRDAYPGDMFYSHSQLLERAGRLKDNSMALTAIPLVHAPVGDITAFLPTNIMSITDGQWILDMENFQNGIRPALSMGLSVTRAGGLGHSARQKKIAIQTLKILADYREAKEYAHFGNELSDQSKQALLLGDYIIDILNQSPSESYSVPEQELLLSTILSLSIQDKIDILKLKKEVRSYVDKIKNDQDFDALVDSIKQTYVISNSVQRGAK
jgi:F-type H+-transporting ATPase subunit alpha